MGVAAPGPHTERGAEPGVRAGGGKAPASPRSPATRTAPLPHSSWPKPSQLVQSLRTAPGAHQGWAVSGRLHRDPFSPSFCPDSSLSVLGPRAPEVPSIPSAHQHQRCEQGRSGSRFSSGDSFCQARHSPYFRAFGLYEKKGQGARKFLCELVCRHWRGSPACSRSILTH